MKVFVESLRELWYSTTQDKSSELNIGFPRFPRLNTSKEMLENEGKFNQNF